MANKIPIEKKKISELLNEKDAFLTTSEKFYEFYLGHTKGFIMAGVIFVLIIIGVAYSFSYQKKIDTTAVMAYESALSLIATNQQNLAVPIEALEKIRIDYEDRKVDRLATFDLVSLYRAQGDSDRAMNLAQELLQSLKQGEMSLKPLLLNILGGFYEVKGDYVKATKSYETLLVMAATDSQLKEDVLISLGRVNLAAGQTEAALKYFQTIITEFPQSYGAFGANYQIAELKGEAVGFPPLMKEEALLSAAEAVDKEAAASQLEAAASQSEVAEVPAPATEALPPLP